MKIIDSIDGVLFDLDDTLNHGNKNELNVRLRVLATKLSLGCTAEDMILACQESDFESIYPYLVRNYHSTPEMTIERLRGYNDELSGNYDYLFRLDDGAVGLLDYLKQEGKIMGIVTSRERESAIRVTDLHGITDYFGIIVGRDDHENAKPHPGPIELALEKLGLAQERAMFVGNLQVDDIGGAKAANIQHSVLVNCEVYDISLPRPTHHLPNINRLHELLKNG